MSTGDQYYNALDKKLFTLVDIRDKVIGYMTKYVDDALRLVYPDDGSFENKIDFSASLSDRFSLDNGIECTDGQGKVMELDSALGDDIYFENSNTIVYDVGLRPTTRPRGVRINPRTGLPQYEDWEETVGEKGDPDLVTDNGSNIILRVNSVCEAGVTHAGRKCLVYLKSVARDATSEAIAVEECIVTWFGGNNVINTSGKLGQVTISETESDYEVILLGPTVRRNTDLQASVDHFFIGEITGNGGIPTTWDIVNQTLIVPITTDIGDVLRTATNGRLKIEVKAIPGESEEPQIEVVDASSTTVFSIDEDGQVQCKDLVAVAVEANGTAITGTGLGSGSGVKGTGGATDGLGLEGVGTAAGHGVQGTGGATGAGVKGVGGSSSGNGVWGVGSGGNFAGVYGQGHGSGAGVQGEAANGLGGPGVRGTGGDGSGGASSTAGDGGTFTGGDNGGGATRYPGRGLYAVGGTSTDEGGGVGVYGQGGADASSGGDGGYFQGGASNGRGLTAVGVGTGYGIYASATGIAIRAQGGGANRGVWGLGGSSNGEGVRGEGGGAGTGVYGLGGSSGGLGVEGYGQSGGGGVKGTGNGAGLGIEGIGGATNAAGVKGTGGGNGIGVWAVAGGSGIGMSATSTSGVAVKGAATSGIGVEGTSTSNHGVKGTGGSSGVTYGVWGVQGSGASGSAGVYGSGFTAGRFVGSTYGVYAEGTASSSRAVYAIQNHVTYNSNAAGVWVNSEFNRCLVLDGRNDAPNASPLRIIPNTGVPNASNHLDGDIYIHSNTNNIRVRLGGTWYNLDKTAV